MRHPHWEAAVFLIAFLLGVSCGSPPPPTTFPQAMYTASTDGVSIRYDVEGVGSPPLVFVHGWSCDRSYWRLQMEHFAAHHLVVAIDLAGHGESGHDRSIWSMEAFGRDVVVVVEKLNLEHVILVGHSMGGSVILEAALAMPERVAVLVPVDTFFDVEQQLSKEQAHIFLRPFRLNYRNTMRAYLGDNMFTPETDPALKEAIVTDMAQAPPDVALGALEHLLTYDYPAALQRIRVPIHCINSDKFTTRTEVARKYVSSFDVTHMFGVGHFLMMEKSEEFNRTLAGLIKDLAPEGQDGNT